MENISSAAASVRQTAADKLDTSQNKGSDNPNSRLSEDPQESSTGKSYKQQLDEAACTNMPAEEQKNTGSLVEKVASFIPVIGSLNKSQQGASPEEQRKDQHVDSQATPKRPEHDLHIEEFLKEQHKSKSESNMPSAGEGQ